MLLRQKHSQAAVARDAGSELWMGRRRSVGEKEETGKVRETEMDLGCFPLAPTSRIGAPRALQQPRGALVDSARGP